MARWAETEAAKPRSKEEQENDAAKIFAKLDRLRESFFWKPLKEKPREEDIDNDPFRVVHRVQHALVTSDDTSTRRRFIRIALAEFGAVFPTREVCSIFEW